MGCHAGWLHTSQSGVEIGHAIEASVSQIVSGADDRQVELWCIHQRFAANAGKNTHTLRSQRRKHSPVGICYLKVQVFVGTLFTEDQWDCCTKGPMAMNSQEKEKEKNRATEFVYMNMRFCLHRKLNMPWTSRGTGGGGGGAVVVHSLYWLFRCLCWQI